MTTPYIRKPYDRERSSVDFSQVDSVTDTSFGNDTDVNNIVERFARTGSLPQPVVPANYADVTGLQGDFTELIEKGKEAMAELEKQKRENDEKIRKQNEENAKNAQAYADFLEKQGELELHNDPGNTEPPPT